MEREDVGEEFSWVMLSLRWFQSMKLEKQST